MPVDQEKLQYECGCCGGGVDIDLTSCPACGSWLGYFPAPFGCSWRFILLAALSMFFWLGFGFQIAVYFNLSPTPEVSP